MSKKRLTSDDLCSFLWIGAVFGMLAFPIDLKFSPSTYGIFIGMFISIIYFIIKDKWGD